MKTIDQIRRENLALLVRDHKTQSQLADKLDKSSSQLSQWLNQSKNSGTGKPRKMSDEAAREIERKCNKPLGWMDQDPAPKNENFSNAKIAPIGGKRVPLISSIQAGVWTEIVDNFQPGDAEEWLLTDDRHSANTFALTIEGDSMLPEFRPGDRVIIDPEIYPRPGSFVAAKNGKEEATFKKFRPRGVNEHGNDVFELVPLNEDFPTIRSDREPIRIIGTMVEHRRYYK